MLSYRCYCKSLSCSSTRLVLSHVHFHCLCINLSFSSLYRHNFTVRSTSFQSRLALTHSSFHLTLTHSSFHGSGFFNSRPSTPTTIPPFNIMASLAPRLSSHALTDDLLGLGFDEKLVRRFAEAPCHVGHAKDLLKSYVPASHKARRGGYTDLLLHKGSRNRRKSTRETQHTLRDTC